MHPSLFPDLLQPPLHSYSQVAIDMTMKGLFVDSCIQSRVLWIRFGGSLIRKAYR